MSHNVETMAWTNEVPWHGLGHRVADTLTTEQMLKAAKLNWKVERRALFTSSSQNETRKLDGFAALVRDSDDSVLDVVGSRYHPIQNEEAFEFFREFVEAGKAKMETAGSLNSGRYVWGLANLNSSFKMSNDDRINSYLLVACPHQQGKSMIIKFTNIRVVCNNTLTLALREGGNEVRIAHRAAFDNETMNKAKDILGIARDQAGEFERNARKLSKVKLSKTDAAKLLSKVFTPKFDLGKIDDFDAHTPRLEALMAAYEKAPGATPGSAYGVLNAATYYADHMASRTSDKRLTNAWLGRTANQKEQLLENLLELAA